MRKIVATLGVAVLCGSLSFSSPVFAAQATPVAPNAPVDAPAYDPVVPAAGEDDLTWAELNDIASAPSSYT